MNVAVVGTGYVGLVTGVCLAEAGNRVICVDNDQGKIEALRRSEMPIFEPDLDDMLTRNHERLSFTTNLAEAVREANVIFLALPTPPQEDGSADLSAVLAVATELGNCLPANYCVVVNKSTVPVGTAETVKAAIAQNAKSEFDVVSNPEFLREGKAVQDFMEPERVVIGSSRERAEQVMRELYKSFVNKDRPFFVTDPRTAELSKYAANTFLVTKISFMNEIAQLSERMGADVDLVRQIIGADSRIGSKFLYPGIGSGGSCFPKDVRALKRMSEQNDYDFKLLSAAITINDQQKHVPAQKMLEHFGDLSGKAFALWGMAFKPGTDDIREAPALIVINSLLEQGAKVAAYDPEAGNKVHKLYEDNPDVKIVDDKYQALQDASALIIATEWPEFAEADLAKIKESLEEPVVFDGRNIFKPAQMEEAGFSYYSIGHRPVIQQNS